MDLFVIHEEDFNELQHAIEGKIANVGKLPAGERQEAARSAEEDITEAEQILRSMNLSARSVPDNGPLKQKMKMYEDNMKQARKDLRRAQTQLSEQEDRDALFAGRSDLMQTSLDQREQLLAETERLQRTNDILADTMAVAEDTYTIGVGTMNDLDRQRSQMMHIRDNLDDINSNVGKAKYMIRSMYRRALANKLVTGLIALVLLIAIFLIVYFKWIAPNMEEPSPDPNTPDASVGTTGGR